MKVYFETLGCPKNFNDSQFAEGILEYRGHEVCSQAEDADAIVVNTCGFINDAKVESIDKIFEMVQLKQESSKDVLLVVSGCLSQRYSEELYEEIPEVDIFIGVNDYEKLPDILDRHEKKRIRKISGEDRHFVEGSLRKLDNPCTATVKISEGCNNRCTYCVIPSIRGAYRSRPEKEILEEAELLAQNGCRELILIAQDVTNYGSDLSPEYTLANLLRKLCRIDGIRWIRLMYCYEDRITDDLIEVMASEPKICHYIDIPLQHISDDILKAMHRRSTEESIKNTLGRLRKAIPDIHIRTTFITGFPGETEEDFDRLAAFVESEKFERLGVFAYSREEGTVAGDMENQIEEEVKEARKDSIMRRQLDISLESNRAKIGRELEVLVEEEDEPGSYIGRTAYDAPEIDNSVIFKSKNQLKQGDFVTVRIVDAFDYDLVGEEV